MLDLALPCLAVVPLLTKGAAARRRAVLAAVRRRPGLPVTRLAGELGFGSGSFYAHLNALAAEGRIVIRRRGKFRLVFPTGAPIPRRAAPAYRLTAKSRPIAAYLAAHPGLDLTAYAKRLPVRRRTAYYHIRRFVQEGLLTSEVPGRYVALRPTRKMMALLMDD